MRAFSDSSSPVTRGFGATRLIYGVAGFTDELARVVRAALRGVSAATMVVC